ncbi:hypothetical protein ABIC89_004621 [Variovorax boronicumulans]|uniref:hypothetical protein n=1 Tax=Variovorax boronicumulans TaxID=436515 RepID=UPI003391D6E4
MVNPPRLRCADLDTGTVFELECRCRVALSVAGYGAVLFSAVKFAVTSEQASQLMAEVQGNAIGAKISLKR